MSYLLNGWNVAAFSNGSLIAGGRFGGSGSNQISIRGISSAAGAGTTGIYIEIRLPATRP